MANNTKDQPGRVQPNESENQPGYEPEKEQSQRQSQGEDERGNPSQRRGFDDQRKDEVSSPPPGGIDPSRDADSGEEQVERKSAGDVDEDELEPRKA